MLAVISDDKVPRALGMELVANEHLAITGDKFYLTDKGLDEKNRLCTLAGLSIKLSSEKKDPSI